jgi:hypothetical protein
MRNRDTRALLMTLARARRRRGRSGEGAERAGTFTPINRTPSEPEVVAFTFLTWCWILLESAWSP